MARLGTIGSALGGAVLAGNLLGAALSIISLFSDQGPPPEQLILEEVGRLRTQVANMRREIRLGIFISVLMAPAAGRDA